MVVEHTIERKFLIKRKKRVKKISTRYNIQPNSNACTNHSSGVLLHRKVFTEKNTLF